MKEEITNKLLQKRGNYNGSQVGQNLAPHKLISKLLAARTQALDKVCRSFELKWFTCWPSKPNYKDLSFI